MRADIGLAWGIKDSFLDYLDRIGDAQIELRDGAATTSTGQFFFRFDSRDDHTLRFRGTVALHAHFGALELRLSDPQIELGGSTVVLTITGPERRLPLLDLTWPQGVEEHGVEMWRDAPAVLTPDACHLFGGAYSGGEPFAPVTARVPRG